jgi:hypothetical protein
MSSNAQPDDAVQTAPSPAEIRYLTPDMCRIHLGRHEALHVTVLNERIYGGVYAVYAFPVAHQDLYICLMHSAGDNKDVEIGIIRDLAEFPPEQAELVKGALARRYFIHRITRIHQVRWRFGMVQFDVDTDKGRVEFLMRWKHDRAHDYGGTGKVLIDVNDNHYLIPDLGALSPKERSDFLRIIYW